MKGTKASKTKKSTTKTNKQNEKTNKTKTAQNKEMGPCMADTFIVQDHNNLVGYNDDCEAKMN